MNRRDFLKASAGLGALGAYCPRPLPNVLLFIVDQMRWPGFFPPGIDLPNYRRLCSRGVEFTNHYVCAAPCSPSRACLMTGRYMYDNGTFNNVGEVESVSEMPSAQRSLSPELYSLGRLFQEAGYATPYFGKWHLTHALEYRGNHYLEPYGFKWCEIERPTPHKNLARFV